MQVRRLVARWDVVVRASDLQRARVVDHDGDARRLGGELGERL